MKNWILLLALCFCLEQAYAQYVNFISTISDTVPRNRSVGGKGQNPRRGILFSTSEPYHYGLKYEITSLRIRHSQNWNDGGEWGPAGRWIQGWIHENTLRNQVGNRIIKFSSRTTNQGNVVDNFRVSSLNRSGGTPNKYLYPNTQYWLVLDSDHNRSYSTAPSIKIAVSANSQGVSQSPSRWFVEEGLEARVHDIDGQGDVSGGWWYVRGRSTYPLQFIIRGKRVAPDPLEFGDRIQAGNLDEPNFSGISNWRELRNHWINSRTWFASSFISSSTPGTDSHVFSLNHITMLNPIRDSVPSNTHFIRIHGNDTINGVNVPGRYVGDFSPARPEVITGNFPGASETDNNQQHRFHVREKHPIYLQPNTRYWIVQGMVHGYEGSNVPIPSFTRSFDQEAWSISNDVFMTVNRGHFWFRRVYDRQELQRVMRFELDATVIPAKGDLNRDAQINLLDLIIMRNEINSFISIPSNTLPLADIDNLRGNTIDGEDQRLLIELIMGR